MDASSGYLLDTNIVLALMRANALGEYLDQTYALRANLNRSLISVVTVGELLSLARQLGWGSERNKILGNLVNELVILDINVPQILEAYAEIDHHSRSSGRSMGKNDIWIAATARVASLILLTTDRDFDHLDGSWIRRTWIDPHTGSSS